jgi:GrpB-like predicted nucleotidyltransferase (UPF0157 family)
MARSEAPVEIVPYDASWPERFQEARGALLEVIGPWLAGTIEHIGSTAIAGLAAKPVIDIMAGVESLDASRSAMAPLKALGYSYFPFRPDSEHWLCKPSRAFRTHHLHLVPFGNQQWVAVTAFRDYLRTHGGVAAEYEALKQRLARDHRFDREAYTQAKSPFITRVTDMALKDGYGTIR